MARINTEQQTQGEGHQNIAWDIQAQMVVTNNRLLSSSSSSKAVYVHESENKMNSDSIDNCGRLTLSASPQSFLNSFKLDMDFHFDLLRFPHPIANNVVSDICCSTLLCFIRIFRTHDISFNDLYWCSMWPRAYRVHWLHNDNIAQYCNLYAELNYRFYRPPHAHSMRVRSAQCTQCRQSTCTRRPLTSLGIEQLKISFKLPSSPIPFMIPFVELKNGKAIQIQYLDKTNDTRFANNRESRFRKQHMNYWRAFIFALFALCTCVVLVIVDKEIYHLFVMFTATTSL